MRISLTIHHNYSENAGAPGMTIQLAKQYRELGHDVDIITFDDLPPIKSELLKQVSFPWFIALKTSLELDVLDASSGDAWLWGLVRKKDAETPLLVTQSHGLEHTIHLQRVRDADRGEFNLSWKYPIYRGGYRLWEVANSMRQADLSLFLNGRDLDYAVSELGVPLDKARLVSNSIPLDFLGLPVHPTPMEQDSPIRIAQLGSYLAHKGIRYSIPATNRILSRFPHVEVGFFGTGVEEDRILGNIDPKFRSRVKIVSSFAHSDLPRILENYHIKLFPSLSEGFGLALIEAMACGLAPVTTTTPGPLEVLKDNQNGIMVPTHDTEAIVGALSRLINNRDLLNRLRRSAHSTAQNYALDSVAKQRLGLYEEFIERNRRASKK